MRHPRSLHRHSGRPPGGRARQGCPASGPTARPSSVRPSTADRAVGVDPCSRSRPTAPTGASRQLPAGQRWCAGSTPALVVLLTAAAAVASMVGGVEAPPGLLPLCLLLSLGAAALLSPRLAARVSAAMMGVLLLPVLLLIACVVRLTSRGPVLVRRPRRDGEESTVARFRTTASVETAPPFASDRLTPVGRVLHALCLDELPRLMDVARGDAPSRRTAQR